MRETTSLGAAIAAGFAVGVWTSFDELKQINRQGRTLFKPSVSADASRKMYKTWSKAVDMCKGWVDAEEGIEEGAGTGSESEVEKKKAEQPETEGMLASIKQGMEDVAKVLSG